MGTLKLCLKEPESTQFLFFQTEHVGLRKRQKTVWRKQLMIIWRGKMVFGCFLSPTFSVWKNKNCIDSGSSRHNFRVPTCYTFDKFYWMIFFGIWAFFVLLNGNFSKIGANLKIMFTVLNSAHLNVSKLDVKYQKTFETLYFVDQCYSS